MVGPILDAAGEETGGFQVVRIYCRSWRCPACGPRRRNQLKQAIAATAKRLKLKRLLTLTLDPRAVPRDEDPHAYINKVWARMRARWAKEWGRGAVDFIKVVEHQESGSPHLHVLVSRYINRDDLVRWWACAGGAKGHNWKETLHRANQGLDIRRKSPREGARYIVKYITKELDEDLGRGEAFPRRVRRWSTSRAARLFEGRAAAGWVIVRASIDSVARTVRYLKGSVSSWVLDLDAQGYLRAVTVRGTEVLDWRMLKPVMEGVQ